MTNDETEMIPPDAKEAVEAVIRVATAPIRILKKTVCFTYDILMESLSPLDWFDE